MTSKRNIVLEIRLFVPEMRHHGHHTASHLDCLQLNTVKSGWAKADERQTQTRRLTFSFPSLWVMHLTKGLVLSSLLICISMRYGGGSVHLHLNLPADYLHLRWRTCQQPSAAERREWLNGPSVSLSHPIKSSTVGGCQKKSSHQVDCSFQPKHVLELTQCCLQTEGLGERQHREKKEHV